MRTGQRRSAWWRGGLLMVLLLLAELMAPARVAAAGLPLTSQHLTTTATCALVSYPGTTTYSTDTLVYQGNANQNYGTGTQLALQSSTGSNARTYVRFDLTKCLFAPAVGAILRSATLRLFLTTLPPACNAMAAFRTASTWGETTVTWSNQPAGTTSNQPPLAQATSQSVTVGSPTGCAIHTANTYVGWDVKTDVAAFLAGTATNYGWMIRDATEDQSASQLTYFAARETNTLTQAPQLLVTYSLV